MSVGNPFVKSSIERSVQDLPALPSVVMRILKETESPTACAVTIERMLSADQALASKVLRVVNSAYYGLSGQVVSLSQAIVILGMQQVRNLVLSVSAYSAIKPRTPRQQETMKIFWLHSFGTAAATQFIAQRKRFSNQDAETAFVGGLLHDIGRLFLFSNFTQTYDQVLRFAEQKQITVESAELRLLGISHGEVGAQMAEYWKLPKPLVRMIGDHEDPTEDNIDPMLYALNIADWITKDLYFDPEKIETTSPSDFVMNWLNFTPEEVDLLKEDTAEKIEEAQQVFGLLAA
ncbi:MAG: HDOD domain-containing protein [Chlorobia bacterium]|nr:HDOD domain-containing protein [Fimbriimonadaceae bacterium]